MQKVLSVVVFLRVLKKKNNIISTSKNYKAKNIFNLNDPSSIKLDLKKIDLILYLPYLKREKKIDFQNQIQAIKKLIQLKKTKTKILLFSTIYPNLKNKFSYSYTKYFIEKEILKNDGTIIRMGFVYNNKKKIKKNIVYYLAKIFIFFSIMPITNPEYKIYTTNLDLFANIVARMIAKNKFKKFIYIIIDKKRMKIRDLFKTLLNNGKNNFSLIKFPRNLIDLFFKTFVKFFSKKIYNKYINLIESENFKLNNKKYKTIYINKL